MSASESAAALRTVEVFADVLCPFTHVGLRTLIGRRNERGLTQPRLRIRAWPLEVVNGKPLDPQHVHAEITALRASVRPDLFAGFSADTFPGTSMAAFALTAAADRTGDPVLIEEVGIAVRNAIFEQGLDIGQTEVIDVIAARFGLVPLDAEATSEAVNADLGRGA
jgi:predicted DsbA family dithiol-disulfide isomerase